MPSSAWKTFDLNELKKKVAGGEPRILEFLRGEQLSCAIYRLPARARDMYLRPIRGLCGPAILFR